MKEYGIPTLVICHSLLIHLHDFQGDRHSSIVTVGVNHGIRGVLPVGVLQMALGDEMKAIWYVLSQVPVKCPTMCVKCSFRVARGSSETGAGVAIVEHSKHRTLQARTCSKRVDLNVVHLFRRVLCRNGTTISRSSF